MQKFLFLVLNLLIINGLSAQSNGLEIKVTDSLVIPLKNVNCSVRVAYSSIEQDGMDYETSQNPEQMDRYAQVLKEKQADLEVFFQSNKIAYKKNDNPIYNEWTIRNYATNDVYSQIATYNVTVKNEKELKSLYEKLKTLDYIEADLSNAPTKISDEDKKKLFERLYKNAKKKAEDMAEITGIKLGSVIEMREETPEYYQPYAYETYTPPGAGIANFSTMTETILGTMVFKFEILK